MQHQIVEAGMSLFPETGAGAGINVFHPLEPYNATPFTPKPYTPSNNIESQHDFTRFGHTNNFEALSSGLLGSSNDTAQDYIVGVCAAAMLIFAIALLWFMVIIGLKIAGQKKVGFLAGRLEHPELGAGASRANSLSAGTLPAITEEPASEAEIESLLESASAISTPLIISNDIETDLERSNREKKFNRKVLAVRASFILSGLGVIISGALFYSKGVVAFSRSLDTFHGGLDLVQHTAYQAINLTDSVLSDQDKLFTDFEKTREDTGGSFCNGDSAIATTIREQTEQLRTSIKELGSTLTSVLTGVRGDLQELITITENVDKAMTSADVIFYVAISISVIIGILIFAMLTVTYFSAKGISNCCTKFTTHAVLWPVFTLFLVLFWIFTLLFLVISLSGSDFCVKPDQIVESALRHYEDQFSSLLFGFIIFYVSGCAIKPDGMDQFGDITEEITQIMTTVHSITETVLNTPLGALETQCGLDKAAGTALQGGAQLLHDATHLIYSAWIQVMQLLECGTFNPIYTTFVHDAVCVQGVEGLTWLFSTSWFLCLFAMIMIMFRAALYPVKRPTEKPDLGISFQ